MKRSVISFVLALILVLSLVSSIGTSTRDKERDVTKDSADTDSIEEETVCVDITDRQERIKCRLVEARTKGVDEDDYYDDSDSIPESCRKLGATSREECKEFYSKIRPCYRMNGTEKHSCFRRIAGLTKASLSGEADKSRIRNYVVALLYDLQERVENESLEGNIDAETAAETVELITQIKEEVLGGASKETIKPMIQELKQKIAVIRG